MTLPQDELQRRWVAARTLRGLGQVELGRLFQADGLSLKAPARIENGHEPMLAAHLAAAVRHLNVPEAWFTDDDVTGLLRHEAQRPYEELLSLLRRQDEERQHALRELQDEVSRLSAEMLDEISRLSEEIQQLRHVAAEVLQVLARDRAERAAEAARSQQSKPPSSSHGGSRASNNLD